MKRDLGKERIGHLDRQKIIDYGKVRAEQGAGPVTLGIDIGVTKMIITHAAVHGLDVSSEPVDMARVALKRLGLIGKGTEWDRRPRKDELNRLFRWFDDNERLTLPMTRIVQFAGATAMRLDEICRVACQVGSPPDPLAFQEMEEAFCERVVMAISTAAHAGIQIVFAEERLPLFASELGALVRMDHDPLLWFAPPNGTQQCLQSQVGRHPGLHHCPAGDCKAICREGRRSSVSLR